MRQYQICIDSAGVYPMGLTPTEKGIHVSVAAAAKECSLLLFSPEKGRGEKIHPDEERDESVPEQIINWNFYRRRHTGWIFGE